MPRAELNETVSIPVSIAGHLVYTVGRTSTGAGLTVLVVDRVSGDPATVYAAETGGTTLANPLTSDPATGRVDGWLDAGSIYNLEVSGEGVDPYIQPVTIGAVGGGLGEDAILDLIAANPPEINVADLGDVSAGTPPDGGALLYDDDISAYTVGPPTVTGSEGDYHENATTTATPTVATATPVDIPSCICTVPAGTTGTVWVYGRAMVQQTVAGTGTAYIQIIETTGGGSDVRADAPRPLTNATAAQTGRIGWLEPKYRLGAVSADRTFKLVIQHNSASGSPVIEAKNANGVAYWASAIWFEVK